MPAAMDHSSHPLHRVGYRTLPSMIGRPGLDGDPAAPWQGIYRIEDEIHEDLSHRRGGHSDLRNQPALKTDVDSNAALLRLVLPAWSRGLERSLGEVIELHSHQRCRLAG